MGTLLFIAVIFFMVGYLSGKAKAEYQENSGEQRVNTLLKRNFANGHYHLLKNITLPIAGGTTQIDHILVSTKGLFVIETKHYTGWIFGNPKLPRWTQTTRWGKYKFQNPLHQNYKHIKELKRYLNCLPEACFKSVVVFTGDGEFKTTMPDNVFYDTSLVSYIKKFHNDLISFDQLFIVVGKLEFFRKEESYKTDYDHVNYLKEKFGGSDLPEYHAPIDDKEIVKNAWPGESYNQVKERLEKLRAKL